MLLEEANLNEKTVLNKINEIRKLEREIIRERESLRGDGVQGLVDGISKMNSEIDSLVNEKIAEKKRQEKLSENNVRIIDEIKDQMDKLEVLLTG
jgi:copper homeostasis protein CutC